MGKRQGLPPRASKEHFTKASSQAVNDPMDLLPIVSSPQPPPQPLPDLVESGTPGTPPQLHSPPALGPFAMDFAVWMRWLEERDATRRMEESQRLEALLAAFARGRLASGPHHSTPPPGLQSPQWEGSEPSAAQVFLKPSVQPPSPLVAQKVSLRPSVQLSSPLPLDVSFQKFGKGKQRWTYHATMVNFAHAPREKELSALRLALSLETERVLEHTLQVPPDITKTVGEVLYILHQYFKGGSNQALPRRAFFYCKQAEDESLDAVHLRLQSLAEEVDLCAARNRNSQRRRVSPTPHRLGLLLHSPGHADAVPGI